jgi:hypothetical protein
MISFYHSYAVPFPSFNAAVAQGYDEFETFVIEKGDKVTLKVYAFSYVGNVGGLSTVKLIVKEEYSSEEFSKMKTNLLANSTQINHMGEAI